MTRQVLILQHVPWEKPGLIAEALKAAELSLDIRMVLHGPSPALPEVSELAGLVLMGGPMGAMDIERYPGLASEAELVRRAVDADVPVLGVCLGHQIIATALGANLHPGATAEFGISPVDVVAPDPLFGASRDRLQVLHWHRDVVDLPAGATLLAKTNQCPNQAFRLGSAVGFQFHLEVDSSLLAQWLAVPQMRDDLPADLVQSLEDDFQKASPQLTAVSSEVFTHFAAEAQKQRRS